MRMRSRNYPKIVGMIGEQFMKMPELNKRAFMCIDNKYGDQYIEGLIKVASPPLSVAPSAKPSVVKQVTKSYIPRADGKRSCREVTQDKREVIKCE